MLLCYLTLVVGDADDVVRFSVQPLTILGVTGPFSVLAENIYELCEHSFKISFLPFIAWSLIHTTWMLWLLAIFNAHDWTMRYVTTFSTEIFALLNSIIYFHKAVQELQRAHDALSFAAFLYAIIGAIGTCVLAIFLSYAERWEPLFHKWIRMGIREYAAAISIIIFIGMPHVGELAHLDRQTLQVSYSFRPSDPSRTVFFVRFWELPVEWIFAAMVPAAIITILFFFDHEVSSIICTISRYGTRKPGGFAWDIVLLGMTNFICGIMGIPPANGLLPQAPLHSESLMYQEKTEVSEQEKDGEGLVTVVQTRNRVYEQRWSHFLHAAGIIIFISPPFMHVLGLTPTSVLAGLFLFMGEQSLSTNPILMRTFYVLTPPSELPPLPDTIKRRSYLPVHAYTLTQIILTTVIFIVTLTKGGPAFPVIIIALVPIRLWFFKYIWDRELLRWVDAWACRDGTPEDDEDAKKGLSMGATEHNGVVDTGNGGAINIPDVASSGAVEIRRSSADALDEDEKSIGLRDINSSGWETASKGSMVRRHSTNVHKIE